ncbi:hypothetical protein ASPTUDRAFT_286888 [Aspergillus tubingensis CBS 134.48]|uniref:Uncharacterized protein n=1 Tax=Aspergillus tubingensis (strain CBS 134.48) TaxID=767770 RepID=A0A1L9NP22_ASPTC|nr:hypothetical protein ASPTUDRAFT_286888 [Aspergillus tubingensis CBS 134.48]
MTQSRSCFTFALSILFLFSVSSGSSVVPSEFIDLSEPVLACLLFSFIYLYGIPASFSGLPPSVFALPSTPSFRFSFFHPVSSFPSWISHHLLVPLVRNSVCNHILRILPYGSHVHWRAMNDDKATGTGD